MRTQLLILFLICMAIPVMAQDEMIEPIPVCDDEQGMLIPILLIDSGFFLDYALVSFPPIAEDGTIDYLPTIKEMMAVRDIWIEAIQPNLPDCVESNEFQLLMGDFLDQSIIQMLTHSIANTTNDETLFDRADIEEARLQSYDLELNAMFEILFADFDVEAALREQKEALEGDG